MITHHDDGGGGIAGGGAPTAVVVAPRRETGMAEGRTADADAEDAAGCTN